MEVQGLDVGGPGSEVPLHRQSCQTDQGDDVLRRRHLDPSDLPIRGRHARDLFLRAVRARSTDSLLRGKDATKGQPPHDTQDAASKRGSLAPSGLRRVALVACPPVLPRDAIVPSTAGLRRAAPVLGTEADCLGLPGVLESSSQPATRRSRAGRPLRSRRSGGSRGRRGGR
jgi:hypothetical protein